MSQTPIITVRAFDLLGGRFFEAAQAFATQHARDFWSETLWPSKLTAKYFEFLAWQKALSDLDDAERRMGATTFIAEPSGRLHGEEFNLVKEVNEKLIQLISQVQVIAT